MKTAVVYFSLDGNTRLVAEKLAEKLDARVLELQPVTPYPTGKVSKFFWGGKSACFKERPALIPYEFRASDYDLIVLGTPLWAGTVTPPLRTFLAQNDLSESRIAAFICCGGGKTDKAFATLRALCGQDALVGELTVVNALADQASLEALLADFPTALE